MKHASVLPSFGNGVLTCLIKFKRIVPFFESSFHVQFTGL